VLQRLPVPAAGVATGATDVNERGQVLIVAAADVTNQAYLLTGDRLRALGTPAGDTGFIPVALNDRGEVAGVGNSGTGPRLWRDGRFIALPAAGFEFTSVSDLNNHDVIVGGGTSTTTNRFEALSWS
jgi:hypothetical protein